MNNSEKFALSTNTFDCEFLIQIVRGDAIICTVGEPAGGGDVSEFCVWNGDGVDYDEPIKSFSVPGKNSIETRWQEAVKFAYTYALERLFTTL